jgi:DNA segregation ATPase FtsK/SpoIIIE-like protein
MEEFAHYEGLPHLWQKIATNEDGVSRMVSNLKQEITRRKLARKENPEADFPWIVVIMDEFRGISDEALVELIAESRSLGIRFILGTQRAEASFISPSIKANLPTGISFHVRNATESRLIIGVPDACNLLPHGDCIVHDPSGITRVQAGWVRQADLKALRKYLKSRIGAD